MYSSREKQKLLKIGFPQIYQRVRPMPTCLRKSCANFVLNGGSNGSDDITFRLRQVIENLRNIADYLKNQGLESKSVNSASSMLEECSLGGTDPEEYIAKFATMRGHVLSMVKKLQLLNTRSNERYLLLKEADSLERINLQQMKLDCRVITRELGKYTDEYFANLFDTFERISSIVQAALVVRPGPRPVYKLGKEFPYTIQSNETSVPKIYGPFNKLITNGNVLDEFPKSRNFLAYGASGSGKSSLVNKMLRELVTPNSVLEIREIYGLLNPITGDISDSAQTLINKPIDNVQELASVLDAFPGHIRPTVFNSKSSRSHMIYTLQTGNEKYRIIDCAGSENPFMIARSMLHVRPETLVQLFDPDTLDAFLNRVTSSKLKITYFWSKEDIQKAGPILEPFVSSQWDGSFKLAIVPHENPKVNADIDRAFHKFMSRFIGTDPIQTLYESFYINESLNLYLANIREKSGQITKPVAVTQFSKFGLVSSGPGYNIDRVFGAPTAAMKELFVSDAVTVLACIVDSEEYLDLNRGAILFAQSTSIFSKSDKGTKRKHSVLPDLARSRKR